MVARMQARGYSADGSRHGSMLDMISGPLDRSQFEAPDDVAQAAPAFLSADNPKPRYMVVPTQAEAEMTIRRALQEAMQLNQDQPFSYTGEELAAMLGEVVVPRRRRWRPAIAARLAAP